MLNDIDMKLVLDVFLWWLEVC